MKEILNLKDLEVRFDSKEKTTYAVNHVSFMVYEGETLGIVGESGSGKSVTAKSIIRIIDDKNIRSGNIFFKGEDLLNLPDKSMQALRGDKISMIFQDPMTSLNPLFTIETQMKRLIKRHRKFMNGKDIKNLSVEWLDAVGIPDAEKRLKSYPHEFSGGMRQRVMIAMALCLNPELIIADEPTTALDLTIQAQVLDLINNLNTKSSRSVILITHDLGVVANSCDRVLVMYSGMIMETGNVFEIFENPKHPYTKGLLKSLPNTKSRERLSPIKGNPPNMTLKSSGCPFKYRCDYKMEVCNTTLPQFSDFSNSHKARCHLLEEDL